METCFGPARHFGSGNLSIDSAGVMNTQSEWIALLLMALIAVALIAISPAAG
jgi:hypothetical protein